MQQAIYNSNNITIQATNTAKTAATTRLASLTRRIAQRWDMIGVLALMTSSATYAVFAIAHVV